MKLTDTRISRVRIDKFGNVFATLEIKKDDIQPQEEFLLRKFWEQGTLIDAEIDLMIQEESFVPKESKIIQNRPSSTRVEYQKRLHEKVILAGVSRDEWIKILSTDEIVGDIVKNEFSTRSLSDDQLQHIINTYL